MRFSFFPYAIVALLLSAVPALVAPTLAAPLVAPKIDPAAVALLDKAVAAYENLDFLSLEFSTVHARAGKAQPDRATSGRLLVQGDDKVRLEWNSAGAKSLFIANENLMNVQRDAQTYYEMRDEEEHFVYTIISLLNEPLGDLMTGDNTLAPESGFGWKIVEIVPDKEFDCVMLRQKFAPISYRIYFDKTTHLIRRVETEQEHIRSIGDKSVPDLTTLTLTNGNAKITPATFVYTPPAGAKKIVSADEPTFRDMRLTLGAQPFAFSGQTLDGKTISLESYKGKVVLLDFWATWCEPCVEELPTIEANYNKYHAQGFEVIAISVDQEEALRAFLEKYDLPWPQILDAHEKNGIAKTYGVRAFPTSFLIDKDGNIAAVDPRGEELEPAIQAALAK